MSTVSNIPDFRCQSGCLHCSPALLAVRHQSAQLPAHTNHQALHRDHTASCLSHECLRGIGLLEVSLEELDSAAVLGERIGLFF